MYVSRLNGVEAFRGKSGSISFHGLTHLLVEEGKLMLASFGENKGISPLGTGSCGVYIIFDSFSSFSWWSD